MKAAWFSRRLSRRSASAFDRRPAVRAFVRSNDTTPYPADMSYRCYVGMEYVVTPKEIPLTKDEWLACEHCGCELKGKWSSRNFDYQASLPIPEKPAREH